MRTISIISAKGGVGKTTITAGLAATLTSKFNKNVLIVDCNMTTSHLGLYTGLEDTPVTLNHILTKEAHVNDALYRHQTGFHILPASIKLRDMHGVDVSKIYNMINDDYKDVFSKYDIVLLDCAPGLGREAMSGIRSADESVLITTPYLPAVMDVIKCNEVLNDLNIRSLGLVVNMIRKHKYELKEDYIKNLTKMDIISSIPVDSNVLISLAKRLPVTLYKPRSKASKMIYKIADHMVKSEGN